MTVLHQPEHFLNDGRPVSLAIGMFDGVHRGHQAVIRHTCDQARDHRGYAVGVTFDVHPLTIVAPSHAPLLIYPLARKLELLASCGLDAVWLIRFDDSFSRLGAEAFIDRLLRHFAPLRSISVGRTFVFGHRRTGNAHLLARIGARAGFQLHGLAPQEEGGQPISSSRIRDCLRQGHLAQAGDLLGRPYTLIGPVQSGDQLGHQLGFPTANLDHSGLVLPPHGVYVAWAITRQARIPAVVNIGCRPSVAPQSAPVRVEAHLLDWSGDLYGQRLELEIGERLREERRFGDQAALRAQITLDVAAAKSRLQPPPQAPSQPAR
jgi:riboflavin kinase/FMN adenylyltransferase